MATVNVAVVSKDPAVRLAAARAFDAAPPSWSVHLYDAPPADADVVVFGSDLRGDARDHLVFDPQRGTGVVEEVRRAIPSARAKVFAVAGAGRGVGVTTLALHLSAAAARDHPTCFIDLDLEWGAAARLGIDDDHLTWHGTIEGDDALRLNALPVAGGFRALLAPRAASCDGATEQDMREVVERAAASFDRAFVDCADRRARDAVVDLVDAAVLVVPATPAGASRALSILHRYETTRWAVVLNRLGPGGETTRAALHRLLGRRSAVELPSTPALRDAEDDAALLTTPWSRYVRAVARLLRALEGA